MDRLNYLHLLYFWRVAKDGTIAAACQRLHTTQSTVSAQIRELEKELGEKLFRRVGRNIVPTEIGRVAYRYADEIFSLGSELVQAVTGATVSRSLRCNIGAQDTLPKLIAYRLLEPVFRLPEPIRVVCHEGTPAQLLPRLSVHEVDLVLSDAPVSSNIKVRAFSHLLGECGIAFFAAPRLARRLRPGFPASLNGAPALLPADSAAMRGTLEKWFGSVGVHPNVVAEFEDIELMMAFGRYGRGFFPAHDAIAKEIVSDYHVGFIGAVEGQTERFYAISIERRLKHPAVVAITEAARETLFARP